MFHNLSLRIVTSGKVVVPSVDRVHLPPDDFEADMSGVAVDFAPHFDAGVGGDQLDDGLLAGARPTARVMGDVRVAAVFYSTPFPGAEPEMADSHDDAAFFGRGLQFALQQPRRHETAAPLNTPRFDSLTTAIQISDQPARPCRLIRRWADPDNIGIVNSLMA